MFTLLSQKLWTARRRMLLCHDDGAISQVIVALNNCLFKNFRNEDLLHVSV